MAGDSVVGALRAVLGLDTASFDDGIKKATSSLGQFSQGVSKIAAGIGLEKGFEKAIEFIKQGFESAIESADKLFLASQKLGTPVEALSGLSAVASKSNVSLDQLGNSFAILSRNMETTAGKTINIASAAFQAMGIQVTDASGKMKSQIDIFKEIADKFATYSDGTNKAALAQAIFKQGGVDLIPVLNKGSKGIDEMIHEFEKWGLVVGADTAKAANDFKDKIDDMNKSTSAIFLKISEGLLPSMVRLADQFKSSANNQDLWVTSGQKVGQTLEYISKWATVAYSAFSALISSFTTLIAVSIKVFSGDFAGALKIVTDYGGQVKSTLDTIALAMINAAKPTQDEEKYFRGLGEAMKDFADTGQKVAKQDAPLVSEKQLELTKQYNDAITKLNLDAKVLGGQFRDMAPGFVDQAQAFKDLAGFGKIVSTNFEDLTLKQLELNAARQNFFMAQTFVQTMDPFQIYNDGMAKLNAGFSEAGKNSEAFQRAQVDLATKLRDAQANAAREFVGGWASAFQTLAQQNKQYAFAAKATAIAMATIDAYAAANKALANTLLPPPLNYIAAAGAIAAGLANVAKIQAQQFATGGSFRVGGAGGIDSQLVQFRATPGEMVDVRKPGTSGTSTEITLRGTRPGDLFTRDTIAALIGNINEAHRDGYRLRFAE